MPRFSSAVNQRSRTERAMGHAAAAAVARMARKLRGRKLSSSEARGLEVVASRAAHEAAYGARSVRKSGKGKSRRKLRSLTRRRTSAAVRRVTGSRGRSRSARRSYSVRDSARSTYSRTKRRSAGRKSARRASTSRGRSASSRRNRLDYRKFLKARSTTYGPVRFEKQPTWKRRSGRKGLAKLGKKARAKTRRARARALRSAMNRGGRKSSRVSRGRKSVV